MKMDKLNDVEKEFVSMLDSKMVLPSIKKGSQGDVKKIQLKNGIFYAAKAYEGNHPDQDYARESTITNKIMKDCKDYLVCFSGSVVHNGKYWLITQFLAGYEELFKLLTDKKSLIYLDRPGGRVMPNVNIYINMIKGLEVLHKLNISHHDIKPENILVNLETSNIKYIDFGMACMDSDFKCGQGGSAAYAAPEIAEVDSLEKSKKSDLWSLGCAIYACEYGAQTLDDPEGYFSIPPRKFNRKGKLSAFLRDVQSKLKFERNGFAFDLTKLLNMMPEKRTIDCYESYEKKESLFARIKRSFTRQTLPKP